MARGLGVAVGRGGLGEWISADRARLQDAALDRLEQLGGERAEAFGIAEKGADADAAHRQRAF